MKKLLPILFCILIVISSCGKSKNPVDPNEFESVSIEFKEWSTGNEFSALFRVINNGEESIWYMGYTKDFPIYQIQVYSDTGWVDDRLGWCGTGLELKELKSHSFFEFDAFLKDEKIRRISITLYTENRDSDRTVWSEEVNLNGKSKIR